MTPYVLISLMPIAIYPLFGFRKKADCLKTVKRNYLIACGILLFLFLALRSRFIGSVDTEHYYNIMKRAIFSKSWNTFYDEKGVEAGFQLFVFVLSRLVSEPQWLIVVTSAFFVISLCFFVYRNSEDAPFSMVMYITLGMMTFEMQGMRQAIAISICLFAFESAKQKKPILFILQCVLAMQFHQTAIVFLPVYIVVQMRYGLINLAFLVILSVIILSLSSSIISFGNQIFDKEYDDTLEGGGLIATLIYVAIIVFTMFFNSDMRTDKAQSSLFYITCVGFVCYIMRYTSIAIAERVSYYFMAGQIAILGNSLRRMGREDYIIIKWIVYLLMILLFVYRLWDSELIPYMFFWQ